MTTRSEREKAQKLNEQHQAILSKMLREDDNKYCADCEAKGPRWASWNLGVFMCIRCAGIHRNLGVHISRVKSVNLDQWTPEQIQSVVDMGNSRAKQLYEAHLPENFKRPQTDQAVEFFIRDKYERKKYYDKNALSPGPKSCEAAPSSQASEKSGQEKEREKKKREKERPNSSDKKDKPSVRERSKREELLDSRGSPKRSGEPAIDLLGLDAPVGGAAASGSGSSSGPISDDLDIFGPMVSNPLPSSNHPQTGSISPAPAPASAPASASGASSGGPVGPPAPQGEVDLFGQSPAPTPPTSSSKTEEVGAKKPLSKDSILSLYSSSTVNTHQTGQAAVNMGQPHMQFNAQATPPYQSYPGVGGVMPPATMMGGVMGPGGGGAMMGQNSGMMVGMAMPNGYMGVQQGMMGHQGGAMQQGAGPAQFSMQQQQQWGVNQMTPQMAGMTMSGVGAGPGGFSQSGAPVGGWAGPPSGQTLSTQLWK
ncbi:stromal membrane-associated protein 1-like [Osmerus mordax]|uniref:stromal membrane-associated protein 1-like n=1 Tax=Osmerus mordax TaxID=8014 RepID=UPI00350F816E